MMGLMLFLQINFALGYLYNSIFFKEISWLLVGLQESDALFMQSCSLRAIANIREHTQHIFGNSATITELQKWV